ncbi:hypothetical protein ACFQVC_26845 [Streptomyces monticola]|uniref:Secreted protein n=1 Tax=Streptomyces monticola TaxID=2666263 RepID=A0ABW2JNV4_9ACTN
MISRARKLLLSGITAVAVIAGASTFAVADPGSGAKAAVDLPPVAVEDFNYPGAAKILAEQGISLKRGDGRITLAACDDAADQIKVMSRVGAGEFCFNATAATGHLTLELADVFSIQTESHPVRAELTADGQSQIVEVPKDSMKGVGEGTGGAATVLLEIRVTG